MHTDVFLDALTLAYVVVSVFLLLAVGRQNDTAKEAAKAALISAKALMNSERAWLMVTLEWIPGVGKRSVQQGPKYLLVRAKCSNDGKTPAWITEMRARYMVLRHGESLPSSPDYVAAKLIQSTLEPIGTQQPIVRDLSLPTEDSCGIEDKEIVYGVVQYLDAFGEKRETRFAYQLTVGDELERLSGLPEYNQAR
ncbi:MAG TPA: hypothetical protein VFA89_12500 [Terriglobales bacterium]|nr:hypothetical protein [Terriglobales bacterium]